MTAPPARPLTNLGGVYAGGAAEAIAARWGDAFSTCPVVGPLISRPRSTFNDYIGRHRAETLEL